MATTDHADTATPTQCRSWSDTIVSRSHELRSELTRAAICLDTALDARRCYARSDGAWPREARPGVCGGSGHATCEVSSSSTLGETASGSSEVGPAPVGPARRTFWMGPGDEPRGALECLAAAVLRFHCERLGLQQGACACMELILSKPLS